jgi:hypothetical protein
VAKVLIGTLKFDGEVYDPGTALAKLPAKAKKAAGAAGILADDVVVKTKLEKATPKYDEVVDTEPEPEDSTEDDTE